MILNEGTKKEFLNALLEINQIEAMEIIDKLYKQSKEFEPIEALIVEVLTTIGDGWDDGTYALAQVYMSGVICEDIIKKYLRNNNKLIKQSPIIAIGTFMDSHSLGKNMVKSMLRTSGYDVIDLGIGLDIKDTLKHVKNDGIQILLLSTLMLSSALKIKLFKDEMDSMGLDTKLIVGGAPFRLDTNLWKAVGADADGKNSTDIVRILELVMEVNNV